MSLGRRSRPHALFVLLTLTACVAVRPLPAPAVTEPLVVAADDTGAEIHLRQGQQLVVRLPGNPATGYRWSPFESIRGVLALQGAAEYQPEPGGGGRMGAGGIEIWRFVAIGPGRSVLRLGYRRSWETGTPPLRVITYTVVVQ